MNDLISRQAAIDVLDRNHILGQGLLNDTLDHIADAIMALPSAQPETHEERTETHACDCISRKAAIEAIKTWGLIDGLSEGQAIEILADEEKLPSAQPEIIYCGDCRYKDDGIDENGIPFLKCLHGRSYGGTRINDFCSWAERRTDEGDYRKE